MIATTTVLQALVGLSDRDAIAALRTDLRWKVAAGLAPDDEGQRLPDPVTLHPPPATVARGN